MQITNNGIITINRGDTVTLPIYIYSGIGLNTTLYDLRAIIDEETKEILYEDNLYFAILEPNQKWEDAIIKKTFGYNDMNFDKHYVPVHIYTEDTEYLSPGVYYYEAKLRKDYHNTDDGYESVETVIPRTKFVIVE